MAIHTAARTLPGNAHFPEPMAENQQPAAQGNTLNELSHLLKCLTPAALHQALSDFIANQGKKSFLVFRDHKYVNIHTEKIACFYIKYESPVIMCFDKQEYFLDYSLEQLQSLLPAKQFYRLNRQYLVNFDAIKEVEYFFARKLLVNLVIPVKDRLIVSRLKVSEFLHWLDNR